MPWWGWLIAGSVAFLGIVLLIGLGMTLHAMKTIDEPRADAWKRRPDGWRK